MVTGDFYRLVRETPARNHPGLCDPDPLQRDGLGDLLRPVPVLHVQNSLHKNSNECPQLRKTAS